MAQWNIPQADAAKLLGNHPFLAALQDANLDIVDCFPVQGFVVQSPRQNYWQIYADLRLTAGIEVASSDIIYSFPLATDQEGSLVWLRRRAEIRRIGLGDGSGADYLSGSIGRELRGFAPGGEGASWGPDPSNCGQCSSKSRC